MITIGNQKFNVPLPRATRTFGLQQRILPIAGDVMSALVQIVGTGGVERLKAMGQSEILELVPEIVPALGKIFSNMPEGELLRILRILLGDPKEGALPTEIGTCDGMPMFSLTDGDVFDTVLQGRTVDMWRLLVHGLTVWYPDFFGLAAAFPAAGAKKAPPSAGSSTSPTSGPASV